MKNLKWKIITCVLVSGLIAFTVYDTKRTEKNAEKVAAQFDMLQLPIEDINMIELIPRTGPHLKLERKGDDWSLVSPIQEPADNQEAHNFLFMLKGEKSTDTVVEGAETNLKTYGLDSPPLSISLATVKGQTEQIKIGAVKAYDSNLYAQINDEKRVVLVPSTWDVILSKNLREFRSKILFRRDTKPNDLHRIEISQDLPGYPGKIVLEKTKDQWKLVEGGDGYEVSSDLVEAYLTKIQELRAQDFHAEDKAAPGTLAKFGLAKPALDVKLYEKDPKPFFTLDMSKPGEHGDAYAVSSDLKPVTSIFKMAAEPMYKKADDFYDKKAPLSFKADDAAKVVVDSPALKATFEKKDGKWTGAPGADKLPGVLDKLSHGEVLRIFEPHPKAVKPLTNSILVSKADGTVLLNFSWGPERIEKANPVTPEARYILGQTNKVDRWLGLSEHVVERLGIADLASIGPAIDSMSATGKQTHQFRGTDGVQSKIKTH